MSQPTPSSSSAAGIGPLVDNLTRALEAATTAADLFPDKSDLSFHRTLDRKFAKELDLTSKRLLSLTDRLAEMAMDAHPSKGKRAVPRRKLEDEDTVVESFRSGVVSVVDRVLEDADVALDEARGDIKKTAIEVNKKAAAAASKKVSSLAIVIYPRTVWLTTNTSSLDLRR